MLVVVAVASADDGGGGGEDAGDDGGGAAAVDACLCHHTAHRLEILKKTLSECIFRMPSPTTSVFNNKAFVFKLPLAIGCCTTGLAVGKTISRHFFNKFFARRASDSLAVFLRK